MANQDSRDEDSERYLPRHEDLPESMFGKVKFQSQSFIRYMLDMHPAVEELYMSVFKEIVH
jgi:hypothetical protein